jgi:hypothetical protein
MGDTIAPLSRKTPTPSASADGDQRPENTR